MEGSIKFLPSQGCVTFESVKHVQSYLDDAVQLKGVRHPQNSTP